MHRVLVERLGPGVAEGAALHRIDLRGHAHLGEHLLQHLVELLVGGAVERIDREGEAVGVAGLGQELLGLLGVVRVRRLRRVARDLLRDRRRELGTVALGDDVDDGLLVDRVVHGLPHTLVVERLDLRVHGHVAHVDARLGADLELAVGLDGVHQLGWQVLDELRLTTLQHRHPGGRVGDEQEVEVLDLRGTAPVVRVGLEHDLLPRGPAHELEGPRADGVLVDGLAVLLDGRRADDAAGRVREGVEHRAERLAQGELHLVLGEHVDALDDTVEAPAPELVGRVLDPVEVGLDRLGVERRAVLEGDALAEVEGEHRGLRVGRPGGRQLSHDLAGLVEADESFVDGSLDGEVQIPVGIPGIETNRVAGHRDAHRPAGSEGRAERQHDSHDDE
ncbi:MAG: hypothetical protein P8Y13_12950 [Deinococcales bacterium]